jgi:tetratricopeptide (TPR) repeat protein
MMLVAQLWLGMALVATPIERAEALAAEAAALAASDPAGAVARADEALELTRDFVPTAFVDAGRKGEVIEDEFLAARTAYRRHRGVLYQAMGQAHLAAGRTAEAVRYLRRARLLNPGGNPLPLARALVELGRGGEALLTLGLDRPLTGEAGRVASAAADAARLPSLQVEIDRRRLEGIEARPPIETLRGPIELAPRTRLSSGQPISLDGSGITLFYVADASCRTCSGDLEALARVQAPGVRIVMAPADPDDDRALRQAIQVYRHPWPFLVRSSFVADLELEAPAAVAVARQGWIAAVVRPPLLPGLAPALEALGREDVRENRPRARWNRQPPAPLEPAELPGLLPEGLAAGEDAPPPAEFDAAVEAFRAGRAGEARRLFDAIAGSGDGWLLPPEARLNRALCLAKQGQREAARKLLLAIGDSRFQEHVDEVLERVGSGG